MVNQNPSVESWKVMTKILSASLQTDHFDFIIARRQCRQHVLYQATVRHEPNRLIASSVWGPSLFHEDVVKEILDSAAHSNMNLRTKWKLSFKRKSTEGQGAQPKNRHRRRQASGQPSTGGSHQQHSQAQKAAAPSQPTLVVPCSSTGQPLAIQQMQYVMVNPPA